MTAVSTDSPYTMKHKKFNNELSTSHLTLAGDPSIQAEATSSAMDMDKSMGKGKGKQSSTEFSLSDTYASLSSTSSL